MRVIASHSTNDLIQVESTPELGDTTIVNGRYIVDIPLGRVPVNSSSYTVPIDGGDISSLAFEELRARHPIFDNIVFNSLIRAEDISEIDLSATIDNTVNQVLPPPYTGTFGVRAQVGRSAVLPQPGMAPNSAAMLAVNPTTTPPRPGILITDTIDISAATGGAGATSFMMYWKVYDFTTAQDISSDFGIHLGVNQPSDKTVTEIDQEPADLVVAISFNDGATYTPVPGRLQPFSVVDLCGGIPPTPITQIRLAFLNTGTTKVYLANLALLF